MAPELELPPGGIAVAARITGLKNDATAELCGGTLEAHLWLHATHCDCEVETTFDVEPHCLLDNRADNLLALARRAASDRPCEAVLETASLDSTQRFGYDAAGRLEVIDDYVDGTHRERTVYRYNANGYLEHALSIDPEEALIYRRTTWFYREDRTLERVERDGRVDENMEDPDGLAEVVTRYTLTSNGWQLRRESRCRQRPRYPCWGSISTREHSRPTMTAA